MAAKRNRRTKGGVAPSGAYGSRPQRERKPLPVLLVVCDDTRAATRYFDLIKRELRDEVTVHVHGKGKSAKKVVEFAIRKSKELCSGRTRDKNDIESTWVLLDIEGPSATILETRAAKNLAVKNRICAALSKPCYDLWILLHLVISGKNYAECSEVIHCIESEWRKKFGCEFGRKADADYPKVLPFVKSAVENASKLGPIEMDKWTEPYAWTQVYLVVEALRALSPNHRFWKECGWKEMRESRSPNAPA